MKSFCSIVILLFTSALTVAQSSVNRGIIYDHDLSAGAAVHTSGWAFFLQKSHRVDLHRKRYWEIEFNQLHHPKEYKQSLDYGVTLVGFNSPKPYVYGKQNSFYQLNASWGQQRMIGQKADKSGVEVDLKYAAGFSLGLLKPYYLDLIYPIDNSTAWKIFAKRYSDETANKFLDWSSIYGASGFAYGLDEVKFIPGIHSQLGFDFDWASYDDFVKSIGAGIIFDAYYKKVPIMVTKNNLQFFPNLYISFQFGKKW